MRGVAFTVPGEPKGKQRPRATVIAGRARLYTPKQTVSEEGAVRLFASQAMQGRDPLDEAVGVDIVAYLPIPLSWSGVQRRLALEGGRRPTGRPDAENISKLICDAMNGLVYRDDALIVALRIRKRYCNRPRIEVSVEPIVP
jgi:Holliday junction resolvase RusA-like endonuclease